MPRTVKWILAFWGLMGLMMPGVLSARDIVVIQDPKPTHVETDKMYIPLELVKHIEEEIDDQNFFASPSSIVADELGNFFVYDRLLAKIFKFDKAFNLKKVFLTTGQGPAQIQKRESGNRKLYFSKAGTLYVISPDNKKIIAFDREEKHIRDIRLSFLGNPNFQPVVDEAGNFYTISDQREGLDVLDKNLRLKYNLLNNGEYAQFLIHGPKLPKEFKTVPKCSATELMYDVLTDTRLLVFQARSSTLYIFKEGKLLKKFNIWPERALSVFKEAIRKKKVKLAAENFSTQIFSDFFIDKDDESFFYLTSRSQGDKKGVVYKFTLDGVLVNVLYCPGANIENFYAKQNQLFYGVTDMSSVSVYKIKK